MDDEDRLKDLGREALKAAEIAFDWPSRGRQLASAIQDA